MASTRSTTARGGRRTRPASPSSGRRKARSSSAGPAPAQPTIAEVIGAIDADPSGRSLLDLVARAERSLRADGRADKARVFRAAHALLALSPAVSSARRRVVAGRVVQAFVRAGADMTLDMVGLYTRPALPWLMEFLRRPDVRDALAPALEGQPVDVSAIGMRLAMSLASAAGDVAMAAAAADAGAAGAPPAGMPPWGPPPPFAVPVFTAVPADQLRPAFPADAADALHDAVLARDVMGVLSAFDRAPGWVALSLRVLRNDAVAACLPNGPLAAIDPAARLGVALGLRERALGRGPSPEPIARTMPEGRAPTSPPRDDGPPTPPSSSSEPN